MRHRPARALLLLALALPAGGAPPGPPSNTPPGAARGAPPAAALREAIDAVVARTALSGARVGICVLSLDTGATLYARGADTLLNPASNVKLFTVAAALARLGPEFRFETEAWLDAPGLGDGAPRALYLRGKGDPTLTTERLWALAGDLRHLGLRRVGDLVLDEGWFDGSRTGAGFDQETGDRSYLAPAGALSLNFNAVAVHVAPGDRPGAAGRVEVEPDSAYFELVNRTRTAGARAARRLAVTSSPVAPGGTQRIVVEGRLPAGGRPAVLWRKIDEPAQYLGQTLRRLLELRGVRVTGRVRLGAVPAGAQLFHVVESEPLSEVVRRLNKGSNNFMAEQLVKALGAASAGPPGSWTTGLAAVEGFLASLGLPRGSYIMRNGSGLNDANRFSARQVARLLAELWRRFPVSAEFLGSLPVAGRDGTLRERLGGVELAGRVRAKTGTLDGVHSLSGYLETVDGEHLAFAILVNDAPGQGPAILPAIDAVTAALVRRGAGPALAGGEGPPAAPPEVAAPEALDAAALTYLAMGRSHDRRNLAFLAAALRSEQAPQLRLAVAEALYRSDPDAEVARRGLLEATAPPRLAPPLARLLGLVPAGDPPPLLAALGDLAGEGNGEAIARLLALAAGDPPPPLRAALAAVLGEVVEAAPDELGLALRGAEPPVRAAATALLGDRLPPAPPAPAPATIGPPAVRPAR